MRGDGKEISKLMTHKKVLRMAGGPNRIRIGFCSRLWDRPFAITEFHKKV
jgi:hypothetical protein